MASRVNISALLGAQESNRRSQPMPAADRFRIGFSAAMSSNVSIEVDKHTADVLQMRAAERGVTVPQLIAELWGVKPEIRDERRAGRL